MAARNAGVPVPEKSIQDGLHFYFSCQTPDGGIGYVRPKDLMPPAPPSACLVMALAKEKNSTAFQSAFQFLETPATTCNIRPISATTPPRPSFKPRPKRGTIGTTTTSTPCAPARTADGSWDGTFGSTFNTAGSLLSLALNYRYLPIYER